MPPLLTTDYLAAEALTICRAIGRPELEIMASDTRLRNGSHQYQFIAYDPASTSPFGEQVAYGLSTSTAELALARLAENLRCTWPFTFTTAEQRESLIRVLNHPVFERAEKDAVLAACDAWATAYAEQQLTELRQEALRRVAGQRPLGVVAEVFTVAAAAA